MTQKAMQQLFTFFILVKTGKAFEFLLPYFIYSPAGFFHLFFFSFFLLFFFPISGSVFTGQANSLQKA